MVTDDPSAEILPRTPRWTAEAAGTTAGSSDSPGALPNPLRPEDVPGSGTFAVAASMPGEMSHPLLAHAHTHTHHKPHVSRTKQEMALQVILKLSGQTQGGRGKGREETQALQTPPEQMPFMLLPAPTQTLQAFVSINAHKCDTMTLQCEGFNGSADAL